MITAFACAAMGFAAFCFGAGGEFGAVALATERVSGEGGHYQRRDDRH